MPLTVLSVKGDSAHHNQLNGAEVTKETKGIREEEEDEKRRSGRRTALPATSTKGVTCSVLMSDFLA